MVPATASGMTDVAGLLQALMAGFSEVLARCDTGTSAIGVVSPAASATGVVSPALAWTAVQSPIISLGDVASQGSPRGLAGGVSVTSPQEGTGQAVVATSSAEASSQSSVKAAEEGKKSTGDTKGVRLADAAKCEVYVCFEGPLGSHLKQEVRDRIWKGEYVEIFSLLPLEKVNLAKVKPDESKKEEEEKRRYRLIPRTFGNWLQAFNILASVIGEKSPDQCSALYCYADAIGEAQGCTGECPGCVTMNNSINARRSAHQLDGTTRISACG